MQSKKYTRCSKFVVLIKDNRCVRESDLTLGGRLMMRHLAKKGETLGWTEVKEITLFGKKLFINRVNF
jgi:hypothetical protein